ncbi:hypothetical protein [Piscinibacter sp. XHJ-5]|uniref:hypothetical protein n=1 Tax=Piscinibacter sp. XHJ-5 TaxID=3037797 RepID=UPI002452E834|nr:hypothetical protein [Piscinibacter sp. XHJ-5]
MTRRADIVRRWLQRAALAVAGTALATAGWIGWRDGDAQAAWLALWSLCTSGFAR